MNSIAEWDARRDLIVLSNRQEAIQFAASHWIRSAKRSIQRRGRFAVALSGGSTPKAIYEVVTQDADLAWDQVWLFWSDERAVPPDHPDSNYRMAMEAGFLNVPIPKSQIHRMVAEKEGAKHAKSYEELFRKSLFPPTFDLIMLGVGEDGHIASLFPKTSACQENVQRVLYHEVPQKGKRMTLTFPCIEESELIVIYAFGKEKGDIVSKVLNAPIDSPWPASRLGTEKHKALWVLDQEAARLLQPLKPPQ